MQNVPDGSIIAVILMLGAGFHLRPKVAISSQSALTEGSGRMKEADMIEALHIFP